MEEFVHHGVTFLAAPEEGVGGSRAAEAAAHRQQQEHGGKQRRLPERQAKEIQINAATPALLNLGRTTEAEQPGPK